MEWIMRMLLGAHEGAQSSEARLALAGVASAVALYLSGQTAQAVHLGMVSIGSYAGSRGLAKAGEAVGQVVQQREIRAALEQRTVAEPVVDSRAAAEVARRLAFAAADREVAEAEARRKAAYEAANVAFAAALPS